MFFWLKEGYSRLFSGLNRTNLVSFNDGLRLLEMLRLVLINL